MAVGKFTWWYENGQKQAEVEYSAGVLDGLWITWHPNGLKESQAQHRNGELVDKWLHWNADGKLIEVRDPQQASTGADDQPVHVAADAHHVSPQVVSGDAVFPVTRPDAASVDGTYTNATADSLRPWRFFLSSTP